MMSDQLTWFDVEPMSPEPRRHRPLKASDQNPMVALFGPGPTDARCGTCRWLERWSYAKVYRKCRKRGVSHSEATDHFATWPACGRYERGENAHERQSGDDAPSFGVAGKA